MKKIIITMIIFGSFMCSALAAAFFLEAKEEHGSRPYYMGFGAWPPDVTPEAHIEMYDFIKKNGDLVLYHFDQGIPWLEALDGKEFSDNLKENWRVKKDNIPQGHKVFIAITPLNGERKRPL